MLFIRGRPVVVGFLLFLGVILLGTLWYSIKSVSQPQIIGLDLSEYQYGNNTPVRENLLVFAFKVSNITSVLNNAVQRSSLDLPQIKFEDINRSCLTGDSYLYADNNVIAIYLCDDISSKLSKDEVMAYSVHEIGHIYLKHLDLETTYRPDYKRNITHELEADNFVVESGIDSEVLISAINKLAPEGEEKNIRIDALRSLSAD